MSRRELVQTLKAEMDGLSEDMVRMQLDVRDVERQIEQERGRRPADLIAKAESRLAAVKERLHELAERQAAVELRYRDAVGDKPTLN